MLRARALTALMLVAACTSQRSSPLETFTGTHTRVAWVQSDGTDPAAEGTGLVLVGLDSADGQGERTILAERASYRKPLITPDGNRVVFSRGHAAPGGLEVLVVNWDGSGLETLGPGFGLAVWRDPSDASEWVYVGMDAAAGEYDFAKVLRFRLDQPTVREVVWDKTPVSSDTFQVSPDGRHAAGLFPWPDAAIAELPNGRLEQLGDGCWTALASVRGPLGWYFDGAHRNLTLVDTRSSRRWTVAINDVPGFADDEVYHPRWANHPRFLVMTGPYNLGGEHQIRAGGAQTEVYLGRFREDYTDIEGWFRVTTNGAGDSYPDVWIDRSETPFRTAAATIGPASAAETAPAVVNAGPSSARVVLDARLIKAPGIPSPDAILPYRNALLVHEYEVTRVIEGQYDDERVLIAHWVIRNRKVLPDARRQPGSSHHLVVERYDAHPELEGERLIRASDAPQLPLYYEVAK